MSSRSGIPQFRRRHVVDDLRWQDLANCREAADAELFFDPYRKDWALQVCVDCPVKERCRAERRGAPGVWGGHYFEGRKPRSRRVKS